MDNYEETEEDLYAQELLADAVAEMEQEKMIAAQFGQTPPSEN